jgi:Putative conjugal transfer nickase/helicase TraI C-term/Putative helicase
MIACKVAECEDRHIPQKTSRTMFRTIFSRKQQSPNPPPARPFPGAFPVLPADELLEKHFHRLNQIDELVGVSGSHFDTYYRPAIYAYARFVQQLPVFAAEHQSNPRSLLERMLDVVCSALKIRRSYLLPAGASTEAIAEKKDLWTYAVFVAALCHDLSKLVTNQMITVYDSDGIGVEWEPWTRDIDEQGSWYKIDVVCDSRRSQPAKANLLLVHRILPGAGTKWLTSDDETFFRWLACLSGDMDDAAAIGEIVTKAQARSACRCSHVCAEQKESTVRVIHPNKESGPEKSENLPYRARSTMAAKKSLSIKKPAKAPDRSRNGPAVSIAAKGTGSDSHRDVNVDRFLSWLKDGIRSQSIKVNEANARVHVVEEGVLLVTPGIFKDYAAAESGNTDWLKIQKRFLKLGLHEKGSGGINVHEYSLKNNNKASTINGILLKNASIVFGLSAIPNRHGNLMKPQANGEKLFIPG